MPIQTILKQFLPFIISSTLLYPSFAMEEIKDTNQTEDIKSSVTLFQESPKYLLHIGFLDGLPENAIMQPGRYDAVNYFSLNGTLPSNDHMPHLDQAPYVLILKLTNTILNRIVGFHVTEVLVAGKINLKNEECTIIAPQGARVPQTLIGKIVFYGGTGLVNRNQKATEYLKQELSAYPIHLEEKKDYFGKRTWDNETIANATINGEIINVNQEGKSLYFSNILYSIPKIPYTCPAYATSGIVYLSNLKGAINTKDKNSICIFQSNLIDWVNTLTHLELEIAAKDDFIARIKDLPESSQENWMSSVMDEIGDLVEEKCIIS